MPLVASIRAREGSKRKDLRWLRKQRGYVEEQLVQLNLPLRSLWHRFWRPSEWRLIIKDGDITPCAKEQKSELSA